MSVIFVPSWRRGTAKTDQDIVQRLLEEHDQLIHCIVEYQNKGVQYQQVLHRNLTYLATIADSNTAKFKSTRIIFLVASMRMTECGSIPCGQNCYQLSYLKYG